MVKQEYNNAHKIFCWCCNYETRTIDCITRWPLLNPFIVFIGVQFKHSYNLSILKMCADNKIVFQLLIEVLLNITHMGKTTDELI